MPDSTDTPAGTRRDAAVAVETAKSYMAKKHNQLTAN